MPRADGSRPFLLLAVVGFVVVTGMRLAYGSGPDALAAFYVVPVAALALGYGLVGGIAGVAVSVWALAGATLLVGALQFSLLGLLARAAALLVAGVALGSAIDERNRWRQSYLAERRDREADNAAARAAGPINDAAMGAARRLVEAKQALERKDYTRALSIVQAGGSASDLNAALGTALPASV